MESFILQGDKSVRYQPLQSNEDENGGRHNESQGSSSQFSSRSYWPWTSLDMTNDYKKITIGKLRTPFTELRNTNLKYGILGFLCFLTMIIWAFLFYLSLKNSSGTGENISKSDFTFQTQDTPSDEDDSLMKNWEKYADEFFTFDGIGTRTIYTLPNSTLTCVQQPGLIAILINSTTKQTWKDFKADKSCADFLIIERLELSGKFSYEDLNM